MIGRRLASALAADKLVAKATAEARIWLEQHTALAGERILNRQPSDVPAADQDLTEKLTGSFLSVECFYELLLRDQAHFDQEQTQHAPALFGPIHLGKDFGIAVGEL